MEYRKFELHAHTSEVSRCGKVPAAEMVRLYREAGYCGMMITDHINPYTFEGMDLPTWEDKAEHFLKGYRSALASAGDGFSVFLGAEMHFYESSNDYLVFGLTGDLLKHGLDNDFLSWGIVRFSGFCRENDLLLIQAHPFRKDMVIIDPDLVDGYEVVNAHPRHDSRNFIAEAWARRYHKLMTAGSDAHQAVDAARSGILMDHRPLSLEEVVREIRGGARLIRRDDYV